MRYIPYGRSVDRCLMALSAQTGYVMPQKYEIYYVRPGEKTNAQ